jgi:imidazoleglycerol-phosphate dehydratase
MTGVSRRTKETTIEVSLDAAGELSTTVPFLDHMLETLSRYSGLGFRVRATGDLPHHISEDVAITLGIAMRERLPATAARYGEATVPMDDALVQCVVDLGGRPYYRGRLPSRRYEHWMRSFADNARATIHLHVIRGRDPHHVVEAAFKALGLALRQALVDSGAVFSTKGAVALEVSP